EPSGKVYKRKHLTAKKKPLGSFAAPPQDRVSEMERSLAAVHQKTRRRAARSAAGPPYSLASSSERRARHRGKTRGGRSGAAQPRGARAGSRGRPGLSRFAAQASI